MLNWYCYEELGTPIYPCPENLDDIKSYQDLLPLVKGTEITQEDFTSYEGKEILVPNFFQAGFVVSTVQRVGHAWGALAGKESFYPLYYQSGRWVCRGLINMRALKKLTL